MSTTLPGGYAGRILKVDLSSQRVKREDISQEVTEKYVGGTGMGAIYLYNGVHPEVRWADPENLLIVMSGPLGGTVGGTGTFSVVTKGPMTDGAVASQANGFLGAFIKFVGLDGIIIEGVSDRLVYLYIDEGVAELRDATHLKGKTTWETEEAIKGELGKRGHTLSVYTIGPAGENLVRFAAIVGDRGHVVAHGGTGAVMGSKMLKAIAVARGKVGVPVSNRAKLRQLHNEILEKVKAHPLDLYHSGTSHVFLTLAHQGMLPVRNYTTSEFKEYEKHDGSYYRPRFRLKRNPCWGCSFNHCNFITVTDGPYTGFVGEEPEYECFAAWGPLTGQDDPGAVVVLSNEVDWLGMDTNESAWIIAWLMECYEKGILTETGMDGLKMRWGDVEEMRRMLRKIAYREGFGDLLAEGLKRAAERVSGEAVDMAIYTSKGNTPRGHDHRLSWPYILDVTTSSMGTDEFGVLLDTPVSLGLPPDTDRFTVKGAAEMTAAAAGKRDFVDSLPICLFQVYGRPWKELTELLNATTGWDFTEDRAKQVGLRIATLLRVFGIRHGHTPKLEVPSVRYGSASPFRDAKGGSVLPVWDELRRYYYKLMGWDTDTGKPLPSTLESLELGFSIPHIWQQD